ncbi:L-type lectin-domain containing receptor kinase V.9-like [Gossypium hirsutum]|uniref:L-type lectin-domain containing receptor kinase V.9-like n=1 Tax=Gossypium hirsutum TaxID=3635 RepID=A0ABM3B007_GOSHI|nr:L-type lectin-domain containing receptor kinase V.9-like [Gossypium hirsutum]
MREFVAEIATIGRLRHPNLVRLLGYCKRKHELLLVYDYMPNGSLDKFLYYQPNSSLNWTQRFKIIKDVASALFYLHQQWVQVIIHRDIKPANVLIDSEMNARLGDFGMAKLCDLGNDPQTSHVAGTLGYMAPELARTGQANTSTDIYAFGIFMLEVACGRKPIEPQTAPEEAFLADWIKDCWDKGDILATIDKRLWKRFVGQQAELVLKLGLLCSHPVTGARPSMSSVISYLDGVASLPDDISSVIKVREFPAVSNEVGAPNELTAERNTVPSLTITEAFVSHGGILAVVDGMLEKQFVVQEAELVLKLGLLCSHPMVAARSSVSSVVSYLDGVVSLPDDLNSVIKAREFPGLSNDELISERNNTIPPLTITVSFVSHGR